jgi:murein DD-endopeptidase MepM/ murein hydrolase activator NlpD
MGIYPAQQSVKALGAHIDFAADMMADTRFDVVLGKGGQPEAAVLYIGVSQPGRRVDLVPVATQAETRWQNIAGPGQSASGLIRPVPEAHLSSGFGFRWHPLLGYSRFHKGVDYAAAWGTPIYAVADGVVSQAGWAGGYGQMVRLSHADQVETGYAHMSRLAVSAGAQVRQGQIIGYVGSTGLSTGPHLHFEVYRAGVAIDPADVRHIGQMGLSPAQRQALRGRVQRLLAQAISAPPPGG